MSDIYKVISRFIATTFMQCSDVAREIMGSKKAGVVAFCDHLSRLKFSRSLPYAFTEHGAIMAASVLNTPQGVEVSVFIVRAFVRLRRTIAEHRALALKLSQIERRLATHDSRIMSLVQAIQQLTSPSSIPERRRIGFRKVKK